jgi:hypothetical protein
MAPLGGNARQPAATGPAQKAHQDQFRLIVCGMSQGNLIGAASMGRFLQKSVAGFSRRFLQREAFFFPESAHIGLASQKRDAKSGCGFTDERFFFLGLGAKAMV